MVLIFPVSEEDRRKYMNLKYSIIINGEFNISNTEILRRLIDCYCETHSDEITEMPEKVYQDYLAKGMRMEEKRAATKRLKAQKLKEK